MYVSPHKTHKRVYQTDSVRHSPNGYSHSTLVADCQIQMTSITLKVFSYSHLYINRNMLGDIVRKKV